MARKKSKQQEILFTHPVRTRVTEKTFKRLENLKETSDSHTVGEVARKVLSNQEIKCFYIDQTLNATMEELSLIRKELKSIGININQLTKKFHGTSNESGKAFYALKVAGLYNNVGLKVDELLLIVSKLAEKWLQKS
jgi:hypothetical protein